MYLNHSDIFTKSTVAVDSSLEHTVWFNLIDNLQLSFSYIIATALILVCIFIILGNSLVVTAIWHENQLHSVTNYLIASLAAADCFVGALVMPFSIISEFLLEEWIFGPTFCHIWHSFDVLASTASIMNLCAISLDRYLAITDPISYPRRMTSKRVGLLIIFLWTLSAAISFPAILWWQSVAKDGPLVTIDQPETNNNGTISNDARKYKCVFTNDTSYLLFSSTISFYGPLCIMLYAYIKIYKAAVRQTKFLNFGTKQVVVGSKKARSKSRYLRNYLHHNSSERTSNQQQLLNGQNTNDHDCQHLVLRVHRGGGASNAATTAIASTATTNCSNPWNSLNSKNCDNVDRWVKSNSVKSRSSTETETKLNSNNNNNNNNSTRFSGDFAGAKNVICQKNNLETGCRIKKDGSFTRRDQYTDWKTDRKDKLRVISQRFEPNNELANDLQQQVTVLKQEVQRQTDDKQQQQQHGPKSQIVNLVDSQNNIHANKYDIKEGKHLLAKMNDKSSGVNVTVLKFDSQKSIEHLTQQGTYQHNTQASSINRPGNEQDSKNDLNSTKLSTSGDQSDTVIGSVASSSSDTLESSIISVLMRPSAQASSNQPSIGSKDVVDKDNHERQHTDVYLAETTSQIVTNSTNFSDETTNQQKKRFKKKMTKLAKERKAAKTLGIVVGVFILCWLPFFVINILVALCGSDFISHFETTMSIVTWLGWLNSAMNPVIYACWSRDFRKAFSRTLCSWIEFLCPYYGSGLARNLRLKNTHYPIQESMSGRVTVTTSTNKSNNNNNNIINNNSVIEVNG